MNKIEFAQQIALELIRRDHNPNNVAKATIDIVSETYKVYRDVPVNDIPMEHGINGCVPIVSIAEKNGEKGVRLCVGDVDIFIEAHDLDNGEKYEWEEAMSRLKEIDKTTFNKHQMYIIAAYKDEINEKLREIGGDELATCYWSSTEFTTYNAWYVSFSNGYINYYYENTTFAVRPVAAF